MTWIAVYVSQPLDERLPGSTHSRLVYQNMSTKASLTEKVPKSCLPFGPGFLAVRPVAQQVPAEPVVAQASLACITVIARTAVRPTKYNFIARLSKSDMSDKAVFGFLR